MALVVRRDRDIHAEEGGWFKARWHFSFDRYRDPGQMGLGALRVFNDDRLTPGAVWPLHPHRDVEGITYVVEGLFQHEDSLGNNGLLRPGGVQRMTLGSGALHSEQNGSETEAMRFLQFWILPDEPGLTPEVEQRQFGESGFRNRLKKVLGAEGGEVVKVHQNASAYVGWLEPGVRVAHQVQDGRGAYLYLIEGTAKFDDEVAATADAAKVYGPHVLNIEAVDESHLILIDVPLEYERVGVWARLAEG